MKKIFIMAIILGLSVMTACSDTEKNSMEPEKMSSVSESADDNNEISDTENEDEEEGSDSEDEADKSEVSDEVFIRGEVIDDVYYSEFNNIKMSAPEGWYFVSEDYILSLMGIGLEITGGSEVINQQLLEQVSIYDMLVQNPVTGENILIMYENLKKELLNPDSISEEDYVDILRSQLEKLPGVTYSDLSDVKRVTIAGESYISCSHKATYETMGSSCVQNYYIRKVGDFMMAIVASSGPECEDMTAYEKYFEAIS